MYTNYYNLCFDNTFINLTAEKKSKNNTIFPTLLATQPESKITPWINVILRVLTTVDILHAMLVASASSVCLPQTCFKTSAWLFSIHIARCSWVWFLVGYWDANNTQNEVSMVLLMCIYLQPHEFGRLRLYIIYIIDGIHLLTTFYSIILETCVILYKKSNDVIYANSQNSYL